MRPKLQNPRGLRPNKPPRAARPGQSARSERGGHADALAAAQKAAAPAGPAPKKRSGAPKRPASAAPIEFSRAAAVPSAALFGPAGSEFAQSLDTLVKGVSEVLGLRTRFKQELHYAVRDLSRLLTSERSDLRRDYLQSPRAVAAYLSYFLPWNVLRLGRLLAALGPAWPNLGPEGTLLDLGSGPLTLPLSLWIARPDLREVSLQIVCVDRAKKPMTLGRELFYLLAASHGYERPAWKIHCLHRSLEMGLDEAPAKVDALSLTNVLNELRWEREEMLEDQVAELTGRFFAALTPEGRLLSVEPGTRWGGKLVELVRKAGLEAGRAPLAPCTHDEPCPFLEEHPRSWCHFTAETLPAPARLNALTAAAKLEKDSLSASFVALGPLGGREDAAPADMLAARVLSAPIRVPGRGPDGEQGLPALGRYACSEQGLVLFLGPARRMYSLRSGDLIHYAPPANPTRDPKTKALEIFLE